MIKQKPLKLVKAWPECLHNTHNNNPFVIKEVLAGAWEGVIFSRAIVHAIHNAVSSNNQALGMCWVAQRKFCFLCVDKMGVWGGLFSIGSIKKQQQQPPLKKTPTKKP